MYSCVFLFQLLVLYVVSVVIFILPVVNLVVFGMLDLDGWQGDAARGSWNRRSACTIEVGFSRWWFVNRAYG